MATYSRRIMVVFGVGMLLVCLCSMKAIAQEDEKEFSDPGVTLHTFRRGDKEGCDPKHSDRGEECTSEDDHLGLYGDVDDTFRVVKSVPVKDKFQRGPFSDLDDSPDIAHNNVHVLGH